MEVLASVDDHGLAGDERRAGAAQERDRADDVLGHLVALDRARADRDVLQRLDDLGVLAATPSLMVKPGATQLTSTSSPPSSLASARVRATIAPLLVT